ncbi:MULTISPECIES: quinone oxidoreductase family protein [unclassified Caulobacter]|uniref:quinone oxidoreductase family protein n=1 Tax=unclassified Caulobacter TaxID=2648921 RepID=UPI000D3D9E2D|nr:MULTISPECIES: quinone oxidoreductase [unclassified Caulobacter]PTS88742.1 quinone oxidoreductase [Caulobacter sp. HMWF009]PTT12565.1 quinone oxidoreductase [Caulobacter sp. HMWF025]
MLAIQATRTGGPEVLEAVDLALPSPGPGQIRVRHAAVGLNFIDTYHRSGLYPMRMPAVLGLEAAGIVDAVGDGVSRFGLGDRVAYNGSPGAYAEAAIVPADRAVGVPDGVSLETAAAVLLKGMTAEFLVRRCFHVKPGDAVLIHAAAGGVGQLLVQWCKALGATVLATVGSPAKAEIALGLGADHVILYGTEDVAVRVAELTGGKGVAVVYDGVGKDTFEASLKSLGRRGVLATFGNASGPVPPFAPLELGSRSLYVTRPRLFDYIATTEELDESAEALFAVLATGAVKVEIGQTFRLSEARAAHEALEGRRTTGATLLIP